MKPNRIEPIGQINRVDFNRSTLFWFGSSNGVFKLAAIMCIEVGNNTQNLQTYGLSRPVMAGNMYVEKKLLKHPPYLFQVAGSTQEQKIFRSFIPHRTKSVFPDWMKRDFTGDTYGEPLFDAFRLNVETERAKSISLFDEIDAYFLENRFSAKVMMTTAGDKKVSIELPINHINVKRETRQWQVETGPILIPVMGGDGGPFDFLPAFVHFNSFDKIDIFYDYPFGYRSLDLTNKGAFSSVPCTIHLYA